MDPAKTGDRVQIHYTGRLEDGTVFDSSRDRDPLEFTAGGTEVIQGVSQAVLGMQPGQSKTLTVGPEEAYGPRQPKLEHRVSRGILPETVKVGDSLHTKVGEETVVVWVRELGEDFGVIDLNHPLAGRSLTFDIELVVVGSSGDG
jgi:peptidylprolyl isomerase